MEPETIAAAFVFLAGGLIGWAVTGEKQRRQNIINRARYRAAVKSEMRAQRDGDVI